MPLAHTTVIGIYIFTSRYGFKPNTFALVVRASQLCCVSVGVLWVGFVINKSKHANYIPT